MKYTFTIEAEREEELLTYTLAAAREMAMHDFRTFLRGQLKYGEFGEEAANLVERIWDYWHECTSDIGGE